MSEKVQPVTLSGDTLQAFETYIQEAEAAMARSLEPGEFLWCDGDPARARQVREGNIVAEFWSGKGPGRVPSGLLHDWIGAVYMPGATIPKTLGVIQDYDNHKDIYKPEVIASRLLERHGDDFKIYLRVLKKKILTVVLDTEHQVRYAPVDATRWRCQSYTTSTSEVDDAGKPTEKVQPPDTGYGFLWRLYSYWRFEEREGGVYTECRAISLTRDIPRGLGWIIEPMVRSLPKDALVHTLDRTRRAVESR